MAFTLSLFFDMNVLQVVLQLGCGTIACPIACTLRVLIFIMSYISFRCRIRDLDNEGSKSFIISLLFMYTPM